MNKHEQKPLRPFYKIVNNKKRNKRRKRGHNYRSPWIYFITINKNVTTPPLSALCQSSTGSIDIDLSPEGRIVAEALNNINSICPSLKVWKHIVMPDHVHFLLRVNDWLEGPLWDYMAILKKNISKAWWSRLGRKAQSFFETGFNDRLITRDGQLNTVKQYIADNPRRLHIKLSNPDYFQKRYRIFIKDEMWFVIGNIFLLKDFDIQPVKVSSKYSPDQLIAWKRLWMKTVLNEGVLVSPFFHEVEKKVRNWALENEGRIIQIMEEPFPERYKPSGKNFDLCAEGRLLQVAPSFCAPRGWRFKAWANKLNDVAVAIANGEFEVRRR